MFVRFQKSTYLCIAKGKKTSNVASFYHPTRQRHMTLSKLYKKFEGCATIENTNEEVARLNRAHNICTMVNKALCFFSYDEETENAIFDECLDICESLNEKETLNNIDKVVNSFSYLLEEEEEEPYFEELEDYSYFM